MKRTLPAWKKTLFSLAATLAFFLLLEGLLALVGLRPVLYEEDPYVGFTSRIPLFIESSGENGAVSMSTAANKVGWFNPQRFLKRKPSGACRIFTLGGSTTYGRPYDDAVSFSGWLRELLPAADPTRRWEVINAGGVSYASYRVAALMEELIDYEPDLFIVYSGHNEFLERRTYREILKTPRALREIGAAAARTHLYALGRKLLSARSFQPRDGSRTLLQGEVDTILAHSIGPSDYARDDRLREQAVEHFRFNLHRIVDIARSAGAGVLFVTPASNLRNMSPFKSERGADVSAGEAERCEALLSRAREAENPADALGALDEAARLDPRYAEVHYERGRALYRMARYDEARAAFRRALDEDVCPLRAPPAIVEAVVEVAAERGAPLVDFAACIASLSAHGITGSDYFLDHVHLSVEGYRLLALRLIDEMARMGALEFSPAWNETAVARVARTVESRLDARARGAALRNLARVFAWARKSEESEELARRAAELLGDDAESFNLLGRAAAVRGDSDVAIRRYRRALAADPAHADANVNLGLELLGRGEVDEARLRFERALRSQPGFAEAHGNLGLALAESGRSEEAIRHYREALRIYPDYAEAHNNLGVEMRSSGRPAQAIEHFRQALRLRPDYPDARANLGLALTAAGQYAGAVEHLRQAARLRPRRSEARFNLGVALLLQGNADEAAAQFAGALDIRPDYAEAHYNLGEALASQGKTEEAIGSFRQALALAPDFAAARERLAELEP